MGFVQISQVTIETSVEGFEPSSPPPRPSLPPMASPLMLHSATDTPTNVTEILANTVSSVITHYNNMHTSVAVLSCHTRQLSALHS